MFLVPYVNGFALGFSLIVAIGAQNAFVLRQGLLRQDVLPVVLVFVISDTILISAGIFGFSLVIADLTSRYAPALFGFGALWLAAYGMMRVRSAIRPNSLIDAGVIKESSTIKVLATALTLTFGNPHVYLDTVVLIGAASLKFQGLDKVYYGAGAATASVVFFSALGLGASLLSPKLQQQNAWRVFDGLIALVMFTLALGMAQHGGWIGL